MEVEAGKKNARRTQQRRHKKGDFCAKNIQYTRRAKHKDNTKGGTIQ